MKVGVVDLVSRDGGSLTITRSLYDYASSGRAPQIEWLFVVSDQSFPPSDRVELIRFPDARRGYLGRARTELFDVGRLVRARRPDCLICLSNMRILGCGAAQYVYLQQSLPFQKEKRFSLLKKEEREFALRQYLQGAVIRRSLRKAKGVFVQTEWMQKAVSEAAGGVPVYQIGWPQASFQPIRTDMTYAAAEFFYPCGPAFYKNVAVLVEAAQLLQKKGRAVTIHITLTEEELGLLGGPGAVESGAFVCMGRVSREKVEEMYRQTSLVFPSYIESLGLPLIEAKQAGTWILASDCAFSREILDDYPNRAYFHPFDAGELARKMEELLEGNVKLAGTGTERREIEPSCWDRMVSVLEGHGS